MRKALAVGLAVVALGVASQAHIYNGLNAGVVVGPEQAHVGLEVRGFPGLFVGIGDRQWSVYVTHGHIEAQS